MKSIQLVVCFILLSIVTNAQIIKNNNGVKRIFFHSHGISFQKFDNLNNRISAYPQYQQLKNSTGTVQLGAFKEKNRIITGFSINKGTSLSGNRNKKSSATSFFGLSVDAGYNLLKSQRVSLYPFAGITYEKYKIVLNKDISAVPFDSVLQSNNFQQRTESLVFTNSFIAYRLGIGMFVNSKKHERNSVGLQVGYTGGFSAGEWKINMSQTMFNSPIDKLSKLSASILVRYRIERN